MKLPSVSSRPIQASLVTETTPLPIKASVDTFEGRTASHKRETSALALSSSRITVNPRRVLHVVAAAVVGFSIGGVSAAPLWSAGQIPMEGNEPAPFPFPEQEGWWNCKRYTDGVVDLQGDWRQTAPDQWGVDFVSKMYPVNKQDWDMEQTIMWDVKESPFRGTHWPANERYGVQNFGGGVHRNGTDQFVWDLDFDNRADGNWKEQWIDTMENKGAQFTRARYSNRGGGDMKLQGIMVCDK